MRQYRVVVWAMPVFMAILVALGVWYWAAHRPDASRGAGEISWAFYVWQRQWSPEVVEAVHKAAPQTAEFMVLAGEVSARGGLHTTDVFPRWEALAETNTPATIVIRADVSLAAHIEDAAGQAQAGRYLTALAERRIAEAASAGAKVGGIQLDYDCPTSKLDHYALLLDQLAVDRSQVAVSITALPTWLDSPSFRDLADGLSYYVLQVHSLERPSSFDDDAFVCRTEQIPGWVKRATAFATPFYLALPTYGYDLAYDESGQFVGLVAEGPQPDWQPGTRTRTVMADPVALANVVAGLKAKPPARLLGVVWFRLPADSDRLNWRWATIQAVMEGRAPEMALAAEIRRPKDGLFEVWVRNTGERMSTDPVEVQVACDRAGIQAHDLLNDYAEAVIGPSEFRLVGPAPPPGSEVLAGWYRCRGEGLTQCNARTGKEDAS